MANKLLHRLHGNSKRVAKEHAGNTSKHDSKDSKKLKETETFFSRATSAKLATRISGLGNAYRKFQEKRAADLKKYNAYENISEGSRITGEFLILLLGSCLIATLGLFKDSSAVIIGAMLIAPLMVPTLGFALGTIWGDKDLLRESIITLSLASILVLAISAALAFVIPGVAINPEIQARINPDLFDILLAIVSGLVGAYSYINPKISNSISGVAIAVALMPPLCTLGIGIGLMEFRIIYGAALLYFTNVVGISLAASFVFWHMHVHPTSQQEEQVSVRVKRKVIFSTIILLLIAFPLSLIMYNAIYLKQRKDDVQALLHDILPNAETISLEVTNNTQRNVQQDTYRVSGVIITPASIRQQDMDNLNIEIAKIFNGKVAVSLTPIVRREFNDDALKEAIRRLLQESQSSEIEAQDGP